MTRSLTKQLLFLGLVPAGIVLAVFSIKLVNKTYSGRVILEIPYALKSAEFVLDRPGNYSIWHRGQFFTEAPLEEFRPGITDLSTGCRDSFIIGLMDIHRHIQHGLK